MAKKLRILISLILLLETSIFTMLTCAEIENINARSMFMLQQNEQTQVDPVFSLAEDNTRWLRTYGGYEDDSAWSIIQTADEGYMIAGSTGIQPYIDAWLMKTDIRGNVQWVKTYNFSYANVVIQTNDGGFALAGSMYDYIRKTSDAWLVKTDSQGNVQWNRVYNIEGNDDTKSVIQTSDGGFILGISSSTQGVDWDARLIKIDANGNREWIQIYGGDKHDHVNQVIQTPDGGFIFTGDTWSYGAGANDAWLVKTNNRGKMIWNRTYGGYNSDNAYKVIMMIDGGLTLVGSTASFGMGSFDAWLIKTDADGNLLWNQTYGSDAHENAYSGFITDDNGYVIAGSIKVYRKRGRREDMDLWMVKTNSNGEMMWNRTYGGEWFDEAKSIIPTVDGGFILAGRTRSYEAIGWDAFLVKTDAMGIAPDIEIIDIYWGEIGLLVVLAIGATVAVYFGVRIWRSRDKWRKKPGMF